MFPSLTYAWSNGASTPSITVTTSGTYTLTVTNSATGCSAVSTSTTITTLAIPAITNITAGANPICSGSTTTLTANGVAGAGATVTWWTGAGGTGTNLGTGTTLSNRGVGTYYARVTGACTPAAEASITISTAEVPAITNISSGATSLCSGSTTTLTANGVAGAGATVTWWTGAGGTGTNLGTGTSLSNVGAGTYYARVEMGTCTPAAEVSITIDAIANQGTYFTDADGDGYGAGTAILACIQPDGTSTTNNDCDDTEFMVDPLAEEVCNSGIDDNCDGLADDEDPTITGQDTYLLMTTATDMAVRLKCRDAFQPSGTSLTNDDCDDANVEVNPSAQEICDYYSSDNDCDGLYDDEDPSLTGLYVFYVDADGDNYGTTSINCTVLLHV